MADAAKDVATFYVNECDTRNELFSPDSWFAVIHNEEKYSAHVICNPLLDDRSKSDFVSIKQNVASKVLSCCKFNDRIKFYVFCSRRGRNLSDVPL